VDIPQLGACDRSSQRNRLRAFDLCGPLDIEVSRYRLQANRKTHEGGKHPDRNAQFLYIKAQKEKFIAAGRPILSIDAKKKEPIGNYKNGGRELCAKSSPEHVNVYDLSIRRSDGQRLMAFTTSLKTKVGSASESVLTPRASR